MAGRKENPFNGCVVVATGKLMNFTRDEISSKILELGGMPGSSVTKKTNYLICGEKADHMEIWMGKDVFESRMAGMVL